MSIPLAALMAPKLDPELDLVLSGARLPRYVDEALRLAALISRKPRQQIVAEALKAYLPAELLDEAYRAASGGDGRS
jgi:hypothetical protein